MSCEAVVDSLSLCSVVGVHHSVVVYSTVNGYLGCFQFRAITKNAAVNILVCVFQ